MNQALSTQIPQIGDSSQQLLARMSAAAADQNQAIAEITAFPSAVRSSTIGLDLPTAPQGVNGIRVTVSISSAPGIETLNLLVYDYYTRTAVATSGTSVGTMVQVLINQTGVAQFSWSSGYSFVNKTAWSDRLGFDLLHSGVSNWTYSVKYKWLKL